jgi:hypothetical protein
MTRDATKPFNGEEQIEKTLTSNPLKLYLDVEKEFDAIRDKTQDLLWPENQDDARWSDVADRYAEQAGMPWLRKRGKTTGTAAFFSCADSAPWILCLMCPRHPPFPR